MIVKKKTKMHNHAGETSFKSFGFPIAGEIYALEYSVGNYTATFEWLGPPDGGTQIVVNSETMTISSTSNSSRLEFRPIQQSHNGLYSCRATTEEGIVWLESLEVSVLGKKLMVWI